MTAFDDREVVKTRKKRSDSHRSVFLWGATPVSLGKTKEMGWHWPTRGAFSQCGAQRNCRRPQAGQKWKRRRTSSLSEGTRLMTSRGTQSPAQEMSTMSDQPGRQTPLM